MKRNLLFVGLLSLLSLGVLAQKGMNFANNTISSDTLELKTKPGGKVTIRIYPNPTFGRFCVSTSTALPLHFYIFDLEGTLVYQAVLSGREKKVIEHLKKGTYLYDVFENDESIEEGRIIVK